MYEIRIYNDVFYWDHDYYTGDDDIKTFVLCDTEERLLNKMVEMLREYEGETYCVLEHEPNGKRHVLIGGAFDPNDIYDVALGFGIEFDWDYEYEYEKEDK